MNNTFMLTLFFLLAFIISLFINEDQGDGTNPQRDVASDLEFLQKPTSEIKINLDYQKNKTQYEFRVQLKNLNSPLSIEWKIVRNNINIYSSAPTLISANNNIENKIFKTFSSDELKEKDIVIVHVWQQMENGEKHGVSRSLQVSSGILGGANQQIIPILKRPKKIFY